MSLAWPPCRLSFVLVGTGAFILYMISGKKIDVTAARGGCHGQHVYDLLLHFGALLHHAHHGTLLHDGHLHGDCCW